MNNLLRWTELMKLFGLIAHFSTESRRVYSLTKPDSHAGKRLKVCIYIELSVNEWAVFHCSWFPNEQNDRYLQKVLHISVSFFWKHFSFVEKKTKSDLWMESSHLQFLSYLYFHVIVLAILFLLLLLKHHCKEVVKKHQLTIRQVFKQFSIFGSRYLPN